MRPSERGVVAIQEGRNQTQIGKAECRPCERKIHVKAKAGHASAITEFSHRATVERSKTQDACETRGFFHCRQETVEPLMNLQYAKFLSGCHRSLARPPHVSVSQGSWYAALDDKPAPQREGLTGPRLIWGQLLALERCSNIYRCTDAKTKTCLLDFGIGCSSNLFTSY